MPAPEQHDGDISLDIQRTLSFSDAIFAFAITLLALRIDIPDIPPGLPPAALIGELVNLIPAFFTYVITFVVVARFWVVHHQIFRHIKRYDRYLLWLNLLLLMLVALLPFPSDLLGTYSTSPVATIVYAGYLALTGFVGFAIWTYATTDRRLVDPNLDADYIRRASIISILPSVVFVISIGIAFFNVTLAQLSWLTLLPASILLARVPRRE